MHQEPWTGLGMDNAALHATMLADAIDDALSGREDEAAAFSRYHRELDEHALAGFHETAELARDLDRLRLS
jgi:flavin-dependent dehydrogenase